MRKDYILKFIVLIAIFVVVFGTRTIFSQQKQDTKETTSLDKPEELIKKYLDEFKKSGVPTPKIVEAAFQKAKTTGVIEDWISAATVANLYINIVGVLMEHYHDLYNYTYNNPLYDQNKAKEYFYKAANYGDVIKSYLRMCNDAYIEIAKLYLTKGDKANALSYAVTAVELSGVEPNTAGEELIKQIIEYTK